LRWKAAPAARFDLQLSLANIFAIVCRVIPAGRLSVEKGKCFVKKLAVTGVSPTRQSVMVLPGKRGVGTVAYQARNAYFEAKFLNLRVGISKAELEM